MKLAASQIAWQPEEEERALAILKAEGYAGLEVAPTRVAGDGPYKNPEKAAGFAADVRRGFGLSVCSMQSIWYGVQGSMFGPERKTLLNYTKEAVLFAQAVACRNLVFGCPKNRVLPEGMDPSEAKPFFEELGGFAAEHGAVIGLEANLPMYGTNFITATQEALDMSARVNSVGFLVNLDFGAMLGNGEAVDMLRGQVARLSHVHISEPGLVMIKRRHAHRQLAELLRGEGYEGYVSIEMKAGGLIQLREAAAYVAEVFG